MNSPTTIKTGAFTARSCKGVIGVRALRSVDAPTTCPPASFQFLMTSTKRQFNYIIIKQLNRNQNLQISLSDIIGYFPSTGKSTGSCLERILSEIMSELWLTWSISTMSRSSLSLASPSITSRDPELALLTTGLRRQL